jgi:cobaltochelatase CobT
MEENADGDSILFAYNRLKGRKEKKKLLIVLSDGQPAAHRGRGIYGFTHKVVKQIEKEGVVDIYGIGIESSAVENFYTQHTVINDSSELEKALLTVLKNKLFS